MVDTKWFNCCDSDDDNGNRIYINDKHGDWILFHEACLRNMTPRQVLDNLGWLLTYSVEEAR